MDYNRRGTSPSTGSYDTSGSCLQGYIKTTYEELESVLGPPTYREEGEKISCEWVIKFDTGLIATIYDYKMGKTPMDVYDWHIGGYSRGTRTSSRDALVYIKELFTDAEVY